MGKAVRVILIVVLLLFIIVFVVSVILVSILKTIIYLCVLLVVNIFVGIFIKYDKVFLLNLSRNMNPETNNFRIIESIKFVFVWALYILVLVYVFPGLRTGFQIIDFVWDTCVLFLHLYSSTVYTKNGEVRMLYDTISENPKIILPHGYFLSPGLWFKYRVSESMMMTFNEDNIQFQSTEEKKSFEKNLHIYKDDRLIRFHTKIVSETSAFFYNLFVMNKDKIRFSKEINMFRLGTTLTIAIMLNIFLYSTILGNYYQNNYAQGILHHFFK